MAETATATKKVCNLFGKCERCEGIGICYGTLAIIIIIAAAVLYYLL